ncbi:hypothetical protein D1614_02165 [Maribellus luteus]|uniref:Uncharacterized protein n=1 Tax=Maribellus luteus TaxID=2305463 RepID=A0A399T7B3_9BACT|nr:hypothetical protein [Maribellus luteus]RIJ50755.1 hypothetical protein D1614_02165 [Maribellus luteus]
MDPIILVISFIMTLAFLSFGVGTVTLERFRIIGTLVLVFLSMGFLFNATALLVMILFFPSSLFSTNGLIMFSSFTIMLVDTVWAWGRYLKNGIDSRVSLALVRYTQIAFFVWVINFLWGIVLLIWI